MPIVTDLQDYRVGMKTQACPTRSSFFQVSLLPTKSAIYLFFFFLTFCLYLLVGKIPFKGKLRASPSIIQIFLDLGWGYVPMNSLEVENTIVS